MNAVYPLRNAPGVYLIIEVLDGFCWMGLLKVETLKKFRNSKKLITLIKFRNVYNKRNTASIQKKYCKGTNFR